MSDLQIFLRVFSTAVFFFIGILCLVAVKRTFKAIACRTWPETEGEIMKSTVVRESTSDGIHSSSSYRPQLSYTYCVNGVNFSGKDITVCDSSFGQDWSKKVVAHYSEGASVKVYYDPGRPSISLLEPRNITGLVFFYVFIAVAVSFISVMIHLVNNPTPQAYHHEHYRKGS